MNHMGIFHPYQLKWYNGAFMSCVTIRFQIQPVIQLRIIDFLHNDGTLRL